MRSIAIAVLLLPVLWNPSMAHDSSANWKRAKSDLCLQELRVVDVFAQRVIVPMLYDDDGSVEYAEIFMWYYITAEHRVTDIIEECSNMKNYRYVKMIQLSLRNSGIIWRKPTGKRSSPLSLNAPILPPGPGQ